MKTTIAFALAALSFAGPSYACAQTAPGADSRTALQHRFEAYQPSDRASGDPCAPYGHAFDSDTLCETATGGPVGGIGN